MTASRSSPAPRMTVLPLPLPQVPVPAALGGRSRDAAPRRARRPRRRQLLNLRARSIGSGRQPGGAARPQRRVIPEIGVAAGRPGRAAGVPRARDEGACRPRRLARQHRILFVCSREIFFPRMDKFWAICLSCGTKRTLDRRPGRRTVPATQLHAIAGYYYYGLTCLQCKTVFVSSRKFVHGLNYSYYMG